MWCRLVALHLQKSPREILEINRVKYFSGGDLARQAWLSGCFVSKCASYKALKVNCVTFDERVVIHRVGRNVAQWCGICDKQT